MSYAKRTAAKRRDARNLRDAAERQRARSQRKNRKRWCKGIEGREHKGVCVNYMQHKRSMIGKEWFLLVCSECKKELEGYYPSLIRHRLFPDPPRPAWLCEPVDDVNNG